MSRQPTPSLSDRLVPARRHILLIPTEPHAALGPKATPFSGSTVDERFNYMGHRPGLQATQVDEVRAGLVKQRGGEAAMTMAERLEIDRAAELALLYEVYWRFLVDNGPMTERGRTRAAYGAYLQTCTALSRVLDRIGRDSRAPELTVRQIMNQQEGTTDEPTTTSS